MGQAADQRPIVRRLAGVGPEYAIYLEVRGGQDREIDDHDIVDLSKPGIERFITVIRETTEGLTALPETDRTYLEDHGHRPSTGRRDGGQVGVSHQECPLPAGKFDREQADLLILLPGGYPDACPDMFFTVPWIRLTGAGRYPTVRGQCPHMFGGKRGSAGRGTLAVAPRRRRTPHHDRPRPPRHRRCTLMRGNIDITLLEPHALAAADMLAGGGRIRSRRLSC